MGRTVGHPEPLFLFVFSFFQKYPMSRAPRSERKTKLKDNARFKQDVGMKWTSFLEKYFLFRLRPLRPLRPLRLVFAECYFWEPTADCWLFSVFAAMQHSPAGIGLP
jgi:hypothetical protein